MCKKPSVCSQNNPFLFGRSLMMLIIENDDIGELSLIYDGSFAASFTLAEEDTGLVMCMGLHTINRHMCENGKRRAGSRWYSSLFLSFYCQKWGAELAQYDSFIPLLIWIMSPFSRALWHQTLRVDLQKMIFTSPKFKTILYFIISR